MNPTLRAWLPDLGLGLAIGFMGIFEASTVVIHEDQHRTPYVLTALAVSVCAALVRRAPGIALGILWMVCALQASATEPLMLVQLVVAPMVAFGAARWGSVSTVWLSALSIPLSALLALAVLTPNLPVLLDRVVYGPLLNGYPPGVSWQFVAATAGLTFLCLPWLTGLALRFGMRAKESEVSQVAAEQDAAQAQRESEQAHEIARLREEQARMARDVHDVVGHSLAVILAQAESAQFVKDVDTQKLKQTMETIATSARSSLQDVRQVLSSTANQPAPVRPGGLDSLIEGVRAGGHRVDSVVVGTPRPLPPDLDGVSFRVLQEMLTNAIKHGPPGGDVHIERHWEGELRMEVRNTINPEPTPQHQAPQQASGPDSPSLPSNAPGQGLDGMRRRLESVGGRLDVRRRTEREGQTFTATAWIPLGVQR